MQRGDAARAYAVYDRLARIPKGALAAVHDGELEKRRRNFELLRAALWSTKEERLLEGSKGVVPWQVPLFYGKKNVAVARALQKAGFESGVYHFDINRNMLAPRFVECVALPCNHRLSPKDIEQIIRIVHKTRRKSNRHE